MMVNAKYPVRTQGLWLMGLTLVMMSSQAVYRAGLVAPLFGSGRVITTSSEERELARSISVRRRCLKHCAQCQHGLNSLFVLFF